MAAPRFILGFFTFLSFRLFRFTLSQPFLELPLTFFAFIVGEDVGEDAPGDVLDFVLRNTGIVDELLLAAQAGCSLRFDMKFLSCSFGFADDLCWRHGSLLKKRKMQALVKPWLDCVCILLSCIISHWERVSIACGRSCNIEE